jgi:AraC family transcriptional regulator
MGYFTPAHPRYTMVITLFECTDYKVVNFLCTCTGCAVSKPEFQDRFSICFIRKGNFIFKAFRNDLDSFNGRVLLNKPGYNYRVAHVHTIPDQCTIISFSADYYEHLTEVYRECLNGFLRKPDVQSILVPSSIPLDYLHNQLFTAVQQQHYTRFDLDTWITGILNQAFHLAAPDGMLKEIPVRHKRHYLPAIERAREFLQTRYTEDIHLKDVAAECAMSPFHFARVFKQIALVSPHQYLRHYRLHHANHLLRHTSLPVYEVALQSGFNNLAHFTFSFTEKYNTSPSAFRSKE